MTSDISRSTFDPKKHYVGVVMQQGRVQLDADWNEQQSIYQHLIETEARDIIGQSGVPERGGGFKIGVTPDNTDLTISPGRMYVDGVLCELNEATPVPVYLLDENHVQVQSWNVDGQDFQRGQWIEFLDAQMRPLQLIRILDTNAAQQTLTLLTDETRFDTSSLKKEWNLSLRRVTTYTTQPYRPTTVREYPFPAFAIYNDTDLPRLDLTTDYYLLLIYLDVRQRIITAIDDPRIREVALNGLDTATRIQTVWQVKILPIELQTELREALAKRQDLLQRLSEKQSGEQGRSRIRETEDSRAHLESYIAMYFSKLTCNSAFNEWDALTMPGTGMLNVRTLPTDISEKPGYQGLANQLYRVEVHRGSDDQAGPSFKWSRDNASVIVQLESVTDDKIVVKNASLHNIQDVTKGQLAEFISDEMELNGLPGHLAQITNIDPIANTLTLDEPLPNTLERYFSKLRFWDGVKEIIATGDTWVDLESGIQLQFSPGSYKSGDYWLIPARTVLGDVEWPPYQFPNTHPIPQPPLGVHHHYARLGLARVLLSETVSVQDCRKRFAPLASQAMRVLGFNWLNDAEYSLAKLEVGLRITLDGEPDPVSVNSGSMILTVEPTVPGEGQSIFIISGYIEVNANIISWRWGREEEGGLSKMFDKLDNFFRGNRRRARVRVILKGHQIWSNAGDQILYLDGQTFGTRGVQIDEATPRHDMLLPSGVGARASDFESWFYLVE